MNRPAVNLFESLLRQELAVAESYQSLVHQFNEASEINDLIVLSTAHKTNVQYLIDEFQVKLTPADQVGASEAPLKEKGLSGKGFTRILQYLYQEEKQLYDRYMAMLESADITKRLKSTLKKQMVERVKENLAALEMLLSATSES